MRSPPTEGRCVRGGLAGISASPSLLSVAFLSFVLEEFIQVVFRSFSDGIFPNVGADLLCLWEEVTQVFLCHHLEPLLLFFTTLISL